jgi:hypothetical protein
MAISITDAIQLMDAMIDRGLVEISLGDLRIVNSPDNIHEHMIERGFRKLNPQTPASDASAENEDESPEGAIGAYESLETWSS